jgi:glycosyltransferase involved in cell wall biosynthesis
VRISLVTIGEPLPIHDGIRDRPHRTGCFARLLADHGHDVTWWTSAFDHVRKRMIPGQPGVTRVSAGLEVRTLDGGGYGRNVSLARFRDQRSIAIQFAAAIRRVPRPDIVVAALPPVELCRTAVVFGREVGVPVVLDMRDMWPDIFVDAAPAWSRRVVRALIWPLFREARQACRDATAITGITQPFVDWGLARARRDRSDLDRHFYMGYPQADISPPRVAAAEAFWAGLGIVPDSTRTIVFLGNLGRQLNLVPIIEGARSIASRELPIRFVLCGNGERLEAYRRQAAGLANVILPGWVDQAQIQVLLRHSWAGIAPLPERYDFLATVNNKAIEYLSAGLPIISSPPRGVLADLLAEHDCGVSFEPNNPDAFASLVCQMTEDPAAWARKAANARALFERQFVAEVVYDQFRLHLEAIVRARRAAAGVIDPIPPNERVLTPQGIESC